MPKATRQSAKLKDDRARASWQKCVATGKPPPTRLAHYRKMAAARKTRAGGRPRKQDCADSRHLFYFSKLTSTNRS